jgi:hypothetical protein
LALDWERVSERLLFDLVDYLQGKAALVPVFDWFWAIEPSHFDVTILFTEF